MALPERRSISSRALKRKRVKTYREVRVSVFGAGSRGDAASATFLNGNRQVRYWCVTEESQFHRIHRSITETGTMSLTVVSVRPSVLSSIPSHKHIHHCGFFSDQTVMAPRKQMVAVQKHEGHLQMDLRLR